MIGDLAGMAGGAIVLASFLLDEANLWDKKQLSYNIANALGALLLAAYAWTIKGYPFLVINSVWCIAASIRSVAMVRHERRKKTKAPVKCL